MQTCTSCATDGGNTECDHEDDVELPPPYTPQQLADFEAGLDAHIVTLKERAAALAAEREAALPALRVFEPHLVRIGPGASNGYHTIKNGIVEYVPPLPADQCAAYWSYRDDLSRVLKLQRRIERQLENSLFKREGAAWFLTRILRPEPEPVAEPDAEEEARAAALRQEITDEITRLMKPKKLLHVQDDARAAARAAGDKVFAGKSCPHGHTSRYVSSGNCVVCTINRAKARHASGKTSAAA